MYDIIFVKCSDKIVLCVPSIWYSESKVQNMKEDTLFSFKALATSEKEAKELDGALAT